MSFMDVRVNGMFEMTLKLKFQILLSQDSGKLQTLDILLKRLRAKNHRVLLFAQMTKMLNIIEVPSLSLSGVLSVEGKSLWPKLDFISIIIFGICSLIHKRVRLLVYCFPFIFLICLVKMDLIDFHWRNMEFKLQKSFTSFISQCRIRQL